MQKTVATRGFINGRGPQLGGTGGKLACSPGRRTLGGTRSEATKVLGICVLLLLHVTALPAQVKIWEGTSCKARQVTLTEYWPEEGTPKAVVIVCPGGSYHWLDLRTEGTAVAEWLSSEGYAAYVLRYRVAGKLEFVAKYRTLFRGNRHPDMICDLQRSIQLLRERHGLPVGVMGFSAGGHLVASAGEFFDTNFLVRYGIEPEVSLKPDFVVPVYPVVTLSDARYVHHRSRLGLLGEPRVKNQALRDSLSLEKHVRPDMPPVFLVNCVDDPVVDYHNSVLLDSALTAQKVPHQYLQLPSGGHGFGADPDKQNQDTAQWQRRFLDWLNQLCM